MTSKSSPAAAARGESVGDRDPTRLERAIQADYRFIWRLLRRLGVPENQAEDAAQQVFLIVAERLADIDNGRERSFAFGTALRVAQGVRRRLGRELASEGFDERPSTGAAADDLLDQKRARQRLDEVVAALPLDSRTVFILFELERLSSPEIAELIDVPLGTVASRLRRARAQFKALVEAYAPGPTQQREGR